jgi:hypothetical protein
VNDVHSSAASVATEVAVPNGLQLFPHAFGPATSVVFVEGHVHAVAGAPAPSVPPTPVHATHAPVVTNVLPNACVEAEYGAAVQSVIVVPAPLGDGSTVPNAVATVYRVVHTLPCLCPWTVYVILDVAIEPPAPSASVVASLAYDIGAIHHPKFVAPLACVGFGTVNTSSYRVFAVHDPVRSAQLPFARFNSASVCIWATFALEVDAASMFVITALDAVRRASSVVVHTGSWNSPVVDVPTASRVMSSYLARLYDDA